MPDRISNHAGVAAQMTREVKAALAAYVERCKRMTLEEFLREPKHLRDALSAEQTASIHEAIQSRRVRQQRTEIEVAQAEVGMPKRSVRPKRYRVREPMLQLAAAIGGVTGLAVSAMAGLVAVLIDTSAPTDLPKVLPNDITRWPTCYRLDLRQDGCVYRPGKDLAWEYVAGHVGIAAAALQAANRHLPPTYIPKGAPLRIVRLHLEK